MLEILNWIQTHIGLIASLVTSATVIIVAVTKTKNAIISAVDKVIKGKFEESLETALEPIKNDLKEIKEVELQGIKEQVKRLDKNQCKNFLTTYLERLKQGEKPSDIENERASEVYKHYTEDLHLNHFIKNGWERLVENK